MDKRKIILFSALIFLMGCGMFTTILVASNLTNNDEKKPNTEQVEKPKNQDNENGKEQSENPSSNDGEQNNPDDVKGDTEEEQPLTTDVFKKPKKTNTEIVTDQESRLLVNSAKTLYQRFEFLKGSESLFDATRKYSEEGSGEILHILYEDGSLLANLGDSSHEDEVDPEGHVTHADGMHSILSGIRDPEMALLGTLSVELQTRNALIPSLDSLNPVFEGDVQILNTSEETGKILEDLEVMYGSKKVYRIDFMLEGYELYAIIMQDKDGYSRLYSINEVNAGETNFLTVSKWNELFKKSSNKKATQTNQESQNKEGGNE